MSEQPIFPDHIIKKAVALARRHGRETDASRAGTGPVTRRAMIGQFTVEFGAVNGAAIKASRIEILLGGEKVFSAKFEAGWEKDPDRKLSHWGPRQDWRSDFMALSD